MLNLFTRHPSEVCLNYYSHLKLSLNFSVKFAFASFKAFIHGFFPFLFIKSTSYMVNDIENQLKENKCN